MQVNKLRSDDLQCPIPDDLNSPDKASHTMKVFKVT